jgi:hypothetical protein
VTGLEPASFEVERFELADNACLELRGRWFGVRGRRFMRPALTAVAGGREQRILAALDHKPWNAEEGEIWLAVFPCSADPAALTQSELTVAPDVTVPLPTPSTSAGGRSRRGAERRSSPRRRATTVRDASHERGTAHEGGKADDRLRLERDEALRSRDDALSELATVKRECERLGAERRQALKAREAVTSEPQKSTEDELRLRVEDLRAEAERERAGARLAAQTARERDEAREGRDEAARERDEARAEREDAQRARNRMLAERDTARAGVEEVTRQWELTAGLGTRRTLERDALAVERDRIARERDTALAKGHSLARERDAALAKGESLARERDTAVQQRDLLARERDTAQQERDSLARERDSATKPREPRVDRPTLAGIERELHDESQAPTVVAEHASLVPRERQIRRRHGGVGAGSAPGTSRAPSGPPEDAAGVWHARMIAVSALFVVVIVFAVLLLVE